MSEILQNQDLSHLVDVMAEDHTNLVQIGDLHTNYEFAQWLYSYLSDFRTSKEHVPLESFTDPDEINEDGSVNHDG